MYSQAAVSSASVAARAVLRWDGFSEKGVPGRPALAGTLGAPAFAVVSAGRGPRGAAVPAPVGRSSIAAVWCGREWLFSAVRSRLGRSWPSLTAQLRVGREWKGDEH